jgi:hypothetical protein
MTNIEKYFDQLSGFLLSCGVPKWEIELFAENLYVDHRSKQIIDRQMLYDLAEYTEPFDALISEGYAWLNMSGLGLLGSTLVVSIEKPCSTSRSSQTSVNFSGPPHCVQENNFCLEKFIEIKG